VAERYGMELDRGFVGGAWRRRLTRTLVAPAIYKRVAYLLTALVLGPVWFSALVAVWSLCAGLIITPFVIPALIVLAYMTRGFAALEAEIARPLLDVDAHAPAARPPRPGFWGWFRGQFSPGFWRAQAYLLIRWFAGFPIAIAVITALAVSLATLTAPVWVPFVHGGAQLGFWRPHTFVQSLVGVPLGLLLLPLSVLIAEALALPFGPLAFSLLRPDADAITVTVPEGTARRHPPARPGQALEIHAAVDAVLVAVPIVIWALTSRGYFWPVWVILPLATVLAIHAWFVLLADEPSVVAQFRGSRVLAASTGIGAALAAFMTLIWAITAQGYFWPVWPMLGIAIVLATELLAVLLLSPGRAELTERIETLETSRAGAVNAQDTELRRIERDLHDGAQARLVALGMSLGMAEQKLAEDPERAGELLAEARIGAEHALKELRDLARGIHPPVLADRGLEAALDSLASTTPLRVVVSVHVVPRPAPAVESAAYFVAAETLANAAKHARARQVDIRIARIADLLELEVRDDGVGGANPNGTGLQGLRRRVEALDGTLSVISPRGGPTTIRAQLPCE
jgi:signal transduction histidine kinase